MKNTIITVTLFILMFLNVIFIICFLMFAGFFVGNINSQQRFKEGVLTGKQEGKLEIYEELEKREYGYYRTDDNKFIFTKENED